MGSPSSRVRPWGRGAESDAASTPWRRRISIRQLPDRGRSARRLTRSRSAGWQNISCFVRSLDLDEILAFGDLIPDVLIAPDQKLEDFAGSAVLGPVQFSFQAADDVDHFVAEQIPEVVHRHARVFEHALSVAAGSRRIERRHVENVGLGAFFGKQSQSDFVDVNQLMNRRFRIIEETNKAQTPGTLPGACIDLALLDTRVTEDAFLRFAQQFVEVDLLVGASPHAVAVTFATLLVHEHDAIFGALVNGLARAGFQTGRIGAVVAEPRKVEVVVLAQHERADIFVPVRRVPHLLLRHGLKAALKQALSVVVFEGLAVVFLAGQFGGPQFAIFEAATNLVPIAGISSTGSGLDVVPVHVVHTVAVGP